ncbi:tail fiber protein [Paenibacillus senegalimassiliensis]|uniref:tail fiber protein n=1 Tax=Paenibacillus senegalimassiliensis TaxID=1737426 RepID=UPI00073F1236|nr:tail fiber protein [Paenibacillus senegalimassiliensis]
MASQTPNLNLHKKDPVTDGNDTFNIQTMMNDNWDKIDEAMGGIDIPDASLDVKGKVQLSSAVNSEAEDRAATPKAVKEVALQAKSYTDQQINLVTETGIPKLVSYPLLVTATTDGQSVFEIPLDVFDADTDTLLVSINRATLDPTRYTVTNTVRNGAGQVTQRARLNLLAGIKTGSKVTMVVLKNVPIGSDGAINGAVLAVDSVPVNRVSGLQTQLDEVFQAGNERKQEVVDALIALGVTASMADSWDTLISKMSTVIRATGNATPADVLAGKTASNAGGPFTGTMPSRGAGGTVTPGPSNQTKAAGYYSSPITVLGDADLVPQNIRSGVDLFGVMGALEARQITYKSFGTVPTNSSLSLNLGYEPSAVITFYTLGTETNEPIYVIASCKDTQGTWQRSYGSIWYKPDTQTLENNSVGYKYQVVVYAYK